MERYIAVRTYRQATQQALFWWSCETYLVVVDDVDDSSRAIVDKILETERLPDDSLACHGGISVNNDTQNSTYQDDYLFLSFLIYWIALVLP